MNDDSMRTTGMVSQILAGVFAVLFAGYAMAVEVQALSDKDLEYVEQESKPTDRLLTEKERSHDVDVLLYAFRSAYGGYRFHDQRLIKEVESSVSAIKTDTSIASPIDLCSTINRTFAQLPDAHLDATLPSAQCWKRNRRRPQVGSNVSPAYPRDHPIPWKLTRLMKDGIIVPVLSITKFPPAKDPVWTGYSTAIGELLKYPAIIIDLRGNGGGDDTRGIELVSRLNGGKVKMLAEERTMRKTPEAFTIQINRLRILANDQNKAGKDSAAALLLISDFEKQKAAALAELKSEATDRLEHKTHLSSDKSAGASYRGRIIVLADAGCGSSCESTLDPLLQIPGATFIGERTAGVLQFGNVGKVPLPSSGILVQIGTQFIRYRDNKMYETVGFDPHITVPQGADALNTALQHLKDSRKL